MGTYFQLIRREFKLFTGNEILMTLFIGGSVLYSFLYGDIYTFGKVTDLPIVVVDKDQSPLSATLKDMLEDNETLTIKYVTAENVDVQDKFITEGIQAAVVIPDQFEGDVLVGRCPEVNTYVNDANLISSGYANRALTAVVGTLNAVMSAKTGRPPAAFQVNTFRLYNRASNYQTFVWPSFLGIILQSVIMVVIALSFASEMEDRTLPDLARISTNPLVVTFGKLSLYWFMAILAVCVDISYFFLFRQRFPLHVADSMLVVGLFLAALTFQGMIAGLLFKSKLKVIQFMMILVMPAYISSGFSWPFQYDKWPAQVYGVLFPFMPFINGFRVLLMDKGTLADIQQYLVLQVIQLVLYSVTAILILRYKLKHQSGKPIPVQAV
ncbi:MAG: ABC transporter permease [Chitinophagaceae bacterium]